MAKETLKKCFVICPIGEEGTAIRARSDDIFERLIKPIANEAGYVAERVIDSDRPGDITDKVMKDIHESDLVVADITGHNPNVFYELAIAHAWRKPFILMSSDQPLKVPFDIGSLNVISIRLESFSAADETRDNLKRHFDSINSGTTFPNPVSRFESNKAIEASGNPLAIEVMEHQAALGGIRALYGKLVKRLLTLEAVVAKMGENEMMPYIPLSPSAGPASSTETGVAAFVTAGLSGLPPPSGIAAIAPYPDTRDGSHSGLGAVPIDASVTKKSE
jgi:hypothetical protein